MKSFVALCCLSFMAVASAAPKPSGRDLLVPLMTVCQTEEGGADSDVAAMMKMQWPESKAGRCMVTCIQEKAGLFKDGKLDRNALMEMGKVLTNNDANALSQVNQLSDVCEPKMMGVDRCEQGIAFQTCLHMEMEKKGIKLDLM